MITYRNIKKEEITYSLFQYFNRHQIVKQCWRLIEGKWTIVDHPFIDEWSKEDYTFLIQCLKNTVATNGFLYGAFVNNKLKGFISVESSLLDNQYLDVSSLHVSEDMRHHGIGKQLFLKATEWAKKQGASKLYISSHSAVETQAFYQKMGCIYTSYIHKQHREAEPYDCPLEYIL